MSFPAWTDNPVADAEAYSEYCEDRIRFLPECSECGFKIQDDYYYKFDNKVICQRCMDFHKEWI